MSDPKVRAELERFASLVSEELGVEIVIGSDWSLSATGDWGFWSISSSTPDKARAYLFGIQSGSSLTRMAHP